MLFMLEQNQIAINKIITTQGGSNNDDEFDDFGHLIAKKLKKVGGSDADEIMLKILHCFK